MGHGWICHAARDAAAVAERPGYDSFSARNVDLMMTGALQLTNFLLKYSSVWFLLGSIAALLGALAGKSVSGGRSCVCVA